MDEGGAAGDRWRRDFAPHLDAAWRLARWLVGSGAEAEDVVQEAFLRAWRAEARRGSGSPGPDNPRAWLLAIVRNAAWTRLRVAARSAGRVVPFEDAARELDRAALQGDPEQPLAERQRAAALRRAIAALPAGFREAVVLRDLEGLTYAEAAAVLGVPEGTVMSRLARGRKRLRAAMEGGEDAHRAG